jgi:peptidoglycan hydrolase-like protein with peptidoglycan-binding domain
VDLFENRERGVGETAVLPYTWMKDLSLGIKNNPDVFALQTALNIEGLYPPRGSTKNECPLTGTFFDCTRRAVEAFQKKYHLEASGRVGHLTRAQLNVLYGN